MNQGFYITKNNEVRKIISNIISDKQNRLAITSKSDLNDTDNSFETFNPKTLKIEIIPLENIYETENKCQMEILRRERFGK